MERNAPRLLLVEDAGGVESPARRLARALVSTPLGLEIARDTEAALALLRVTYFEAVLLHWDLSDPRTFEFLRRAAALVVRPATIVMTAEDDEQRELQAMHLGASDFVDPKCLGEAALLRIIRTATLRKLVLETLRDQSIVDPVTGVKSRAYFNELYDAELNRAAHDAKQLVHVRDSEINTIVNRLRHREEALAIAQRTTEMQQAEIARLRHAMEMSGAQNASRFKLRPTEWTIHDYRAEYDRLNVELSKLRERLAVAYDREANQVKELRTELQQLADHVVAAASALPDEGEARRAIAHHAAADQPRQLASPTEQMDAPMRSIDAIIGDSVGGARASGLSDGSVPTRRSARSGGALARAADAPKRLALGAVQKVAGLAGATGKAMRVVSGSARNEEPAPMPGEVSAARLLGGAAVSDTHTDGSRVSGVGPAITKSADARPGSLSADAAAPKSPPETEAKERPDAPDDATPGPVDAATASVPEASAARASQPQTTGHTPPPEPDKARDQTDGDGSLYDSYRSAKPASAKPASDKPASDKAASDEPGSGKRTDAGATAAPAPSEAEAAAHTEEPAPAEQTSKASHTPTGSEDRAPEPGPTDANATGGETPGSLLDRLKHVPESETR